MKICSEKTGRNNLGGGGTMNMNNELFTIVLGYMLCFSKIVWGKTALTCKTMCKCFFTDVSILIFLCMQVYVEEHISK